MGYVWCEIRQQSFEEPYDETSFRKKDLECIPAAFLHCFACVELDEIASFPTLCGEFSQHHLFWRNGETLNEVVGTSIRFELYLLNLI